MTEDNERLLRQFFSEAAREQIEDGGFTDRVMQRIEAEQSSALSPQTSMFIRLWTPFCIMVFVVLFVYFRGWELLAVHFEVMLRTMATQSFSVNLLAVATILFGLLFVGVGEVISSETVRK